MKRMCSLFLALALILAFLPVSPAHAEEIKPFETYNFGKQRYSAWSSPVDSYLIPTETGYERVEFGVTLNDQRSLIVEDYLEGTMQCVSSRTVPLELPIFGGFYSGENFRYVVSGQSNPDESDDCEVIRVTRYDRDWNRMDHVSICGINTTYPFDAGSLRMAETGNRLFIRTCHEMYTNPEDGHNHQANLQILIDTDTMTVMDTVHDVHNSGVGYVSHSFNQFGILDGSDYIAADHGDAHPRSFIFFRYENADTMTAFRDEPDRWPRHVESASFLDFVGETGQNATGASLGGLEASDTCYLAAGNSFDQDSETASYGDARNIFVAAVPKDSFDSESVQIRWLTDYPADSEVSASTPQLVKLSSDRFLLLWTADSLHYIFLDGTGTPVSEEYTNPGALSDCKPIFHNGQVLWYCTDDSIPFFYSIDPEHPETVVRTCYHTHEWSEWETDPDYLLEQHRTCSICREVETRRNEHPFRDVNESDYFYTPVMWALENRITGGMGPETFGPNETCTRAQIVTFLWAAMGRPEPSADTCCFQDVPYGIYYETPVLWAVENGITSGIDANRFGPDFRCTRAQIMTFLWAAKGRPEPVSIASGFTDVPAGAYYEKAVCWAVENGITGGMGNGIFGSDYTCTRAQAVTFLYQAFGK